MKTLFQSLIGLSMLAAAGLGAVALAGPATAVGAPGDAATPLYYGRWVVNEERPVFTQRGRFYKTIDVAKCGGDFCGVSVDDKGKCGTVLFRFLGKNAAADSLRGHGKWGAETKNLVIYSDGGGSDGSERNFDLYLGDGTNFGERSGNMPKFHAQYRRTGAAKCVAR
ncbi:MAG: hypothetical protein V4459_08150 [Pseudomonadota bacterium]